VRVRYVAHCCNRGHRICMRSDNHFYHIGRMYRQLPDYSWCWNHSWLSDLRWNHDNGLCCLRSYPVRGNNNLRVQSVSTVQSVCKQDVLSHSMCGFRRWLSHLLPVRRKNRTLYVAHSSGCWIYRLWNWKFRHIVGRYVHRSGCLHLNSMGPRNHGWWCWLRHLLHWNHRE